jgi:catechol 2,3-dioxygenase-like lactoylglutathione lyase family enzyme
MVTTVSAFSGFSVDAIDKAKEFYTTVLGLQTEDEMGGLRLHLPGGGTVYVYSKPDHEPATYTVLNLVVANIDIAVDELTAQGMTIERYPEMSYQDEKGIARGKSTNMGPDIAWFKDPAGNILSVLQD